MRNVQQRSSPFCNVLDHDASLPLATDSKGPYRLPPVDDLDYYGECHAARETGGDFFDFLAPFKSILMLSIGEVSRQGSSSPDLIRQLQVSLRELVSCRRQSLSLMVQELNRILCECYADAPKVTLFLAQIDSQRLEVHYVNAGHEPALLIRDKARQILPLPGSGADLGVTPHTRYEQKMVGLQPGDILVALTAGVTSARDSDDCAIHEKLLLDTVRRNPRARASDMVGQILHGVEALPREIAPPDDRTVIVARLLARA